MDTEYRTGIELRAANGRLEGYAAVFDSPSQDLGGFIEIVKPGAFTRSLADPERITARYDHDSKAILGRVGAGTLRLHEDTRGLHFDIQLPGTTIGNDLGILVERGDITGASFAFLTRKDDWDFDGDLPLRSLIDVELKEITITSDPAYLDTQVAMRSLQLCSVRTKFPKHQAALRYLETAIWV